MSLTQITRDAVNQAIDEFDQLGRTAFLDKYGFGRAIKYMVVRDGKAYDSKAILGAAHGFAVPTEGALRPSDFSGGEGHAKARLEALGFEVRNAAAPLALTHGATEAERMRREAMWRALVARSGRGGFSPALVRELGFYGGQQGIWVDAARTANVALPGVTVSVLHRGTRYADDLWDDGLLYHYPGTRRGTRDDAEIEATKNTARLGLPLFVITNAKDDAGARDVRKAWIEEWDDSDRVFLVRFGEYPPPPIVSPAPDSPFQLEDDGKKGTAQVETRLGQQRFKLDCIAYYGATCAVCDMELRPLLDGAHIRPKKQRGSDDPRNGLILCASHHRAYDAQFFAVEPETLRIALKEGGPSRDALRITRQSLGHLNKKPHTDALRWAWERWRATPQAPSSP